MYQYPKNFLSIPQLIQKLIDAGMEVSSPEEAEQSLMTVGYYRLKGYAFQWLDSKKYRPSTNFSDVLKLYHFNCELSLLLFSYLSQIEVALRARLVQVLQPFGDALILNDPSKFHGKSKFWQNQGVIASEIARSKDIFIQHNFDNHDGAVPLWAAVEIMSFGTLSKVISNLKSGEGTPSKALASYYKYKNSKNGMSIPKLDMLSSWIHSTSILRNICAHDGRIYNRTFEKPPKLLDEDKVPANSITGLYQMILAMKYLRPSDESWSIFISALNVLLERYSDVCELRRMNFPADWKAHLFLNDSGTNRID